MTKWRDKNRKALRAYDREFYRRRTKGKNGGPVRKQSYHGLTGTTEYGLLIHAKERAKKNRLPFNLEIQDIVIPSRCPVLGIEIRPAIGKPDAHSPSVDKIIPARGYVRGNVRVISWRANSLRNNGTAAELRLVAIDAERLEEAS